MAELAAGRCGSDEVLLLLAKVNVEKGLFGAPLEARLLMLEALAGTRPTWSAAAANRARFVDKAEALRPLYPDRTDLRFVVGYDTLVRLFDPRFYGDMPSELDRLFGSSRFLAVNRGEQDPAAVRRLLDGPEARAYRDRFEVLELDPRHAAMSSSEARERLRGGEAVGDLVPEAVEGMIGRMGLYRNPT
jgi:nicotinic acid mononucleotide adenylyltransferase